MDITNTQASANNDGEVTPTTAKIEQLRDKTKTQVIFPQTITRAIYDSDTLETLEQTLSKTSISVDSLTERDAIPLAKRGNGRLVRVNDIGDGSSATYVWDDRNSIWVQEFSTIIKLEDKVDTISTKLSWKKL